MYGRDIRGMTPYDSGAIQSPPIELEWMGWRADTHHLQRHGWQFAASEHEDYRRMGSIFELAIHHPECKVEGLTRTVRDRYRDERQYMDDPRMMEDYHMRYGRERDRDRGRGRHRYPRHMHIELAHHMYVQAESMVGYYHPVDMRPDRYPDEVQQIPLHRLPIFRRIQKEGIYLHEASMNEVLKFALDKQAPKQSEIRKRILDGKSYATPKSELLLVG